MHRKGQSLQEIISSGCYDAILHYDGWEVMERYVRENNPQNLADAILAKLKKPHKYVSVIDRLDIPER